MNNQETNFTDKEVVEQFVKDPKYKENHRNAALQLHKIFGKKWFTVSDVVKKSLIKDPKEVAQLMYGLHLFGFCTSKEGGQLYKYQTKFQLMITPKDKLKVLEGEKEQTEMQLSLINQEIEKVQKEILESSTMEE